MFERCLKSLCWLAFAISTSAPLIAQPRVVDQLRITRSQTTGRASFIAPVQGTSLPVAAANGRQATTADFLQQYGHHFGVRQPATELAQPKVEVDHLGYTHSTYAQVYKGVPVFSGIIKVHQDAAGRFTAANGDFYAIPVTLDPVARLSADQAVARAAAALAVQAPAVEVAELTIVDPGWYGDPPAGVHLAYHVILSDLAAGVREAFFVDAQNGKALDQWSLLETIKNRDVFDDLAGVFVRFEGDPPAGDFDADAAYDYASDIYDYLLRAFSRDSIDNAGTTLHATVHLQSTSCPNAFGGTGGTFYCDGIVTDDIVAHEFTHGLTGFTAGLIYQNQPGQINESYSDVIGEIVDLLNGDAAFAGPPGGTSWPPHDTGPGTDAPNDLRTGCVTGTEMEVTSPPEIAGNYLAQGAAFGPPLDSTGVSGEVVLANPARACDADLPFTNSGEFAGRIVLVDRGTCTFVEKVLNAQDFGAIAVIVANNVPGGPAPMGGSSGAVVIPSVGITLDDGNLLKEALTEGTVEVTLRDLGGTGGVRWLVSEDSSGFGGAIRDMWQPSCEGDPDTANHPFQTCSPEDNGGVHSGSGVPNHAFAIATDGKTFNGYTVNGIGLFKAGAVWYRALTVYLTPTSDFIDAYVALNQAAADLVGTMIKDPRDGSNYAMFTAADAQEVDQALLAVEMNTNGRCGGGQVLVGDPAPVCDPHTPLYADDFESGVNGWTVSMSGAPATPYDWVQTGGLPLGRPGTAWFADDPDSGDCAGVDESAVHVLTSPPIALPGTLSSVFLTFTHYVESESFYDGGNVKMSINAGPFTLIPSSAIAHNPYNGSLRSSENTNPMAGQPAWNGISLDGPVWGTTLIDLSSFVAGGETVRFQFEFGKDCCCAPFNAGWYVDDFELLTCGSALLAPQPEAGGVDKNRYISFVVPTGAPGPDTAVRVRLASLHHPAGPPDAPNFGAFEGQYRYLNAILDGGNNPVFTCADSAGTGSSFRCAKLGCTPEYRDWSGIFGGETVQVTGDSVVPSSQYAIAQLASSCAGNETSCADASAELAVGTERWGNVDSSPAGGAPSATDIGRVVDKAKDLAAAFIEPRCQLRDATPNPFGSPVNAQDIGRIVDAVKGLPYPFTISACP